MKNIHSEYLISSLTEQNPFMKTDDFMDWFAKRREAHRFHIERIPFSKLNNWSFDSGTGNLTHVSGKFFRIEGIWVESNAGYKSQWTQPIINQPEIGILGILAKRFGGVLYFLMQAKMEPGNIDMVQLAPTLQATRSNFTRVHQGRTPPYLEYFLDRKYGRPLLDILQSEQGARFLRKRNRNIIIEVEGDIPVLDDYCWLSLGQINRLIQMNNVVNMDARTVLSCIDVCIPLGRGNDVLELLDNLRVSAASNGVKLTPIVDNFRSRILASAFDRENAKYSKEEVISWFTELKFRYELNVERIPLKYVQDWIRSEDAIYHREQKYFSVIGVRVEAANREVPSWSQPLVEPRQQGVLAFIVKEINGILHFLIQGKVEAGNFDVVEMAPTVQCMTGSYRDVPVNDRPPFLDFVLNVPEESIRYRALQSEEGGRFFHDQNINLIVEADSDFSEKVPSNYTWMTLSQLKEFIRYNNFVNVQARCLLACLSLL